MASYFLLVIMILFSFSASAHEGGKEGGHAASGASRTVNIFVSYKKKKAVMTVVSQLIWKFFFEAAVSAQSLLLSVCVCVCCVLLSWL